MTIDDLAERYSEIAENLREVRGYQPVEKLLLVGADYAYVAYLLESGFDLAGLCGQLRRGLNRSSGYAYAEKRGKTLAVMAATIERAVKEEEKDKEVRLAIANYLENMARGFPTCPYCEKPVERKEQIGLCVYAKPCGHRLYQGSLPEAER